MYLVRMKGSLIYHETIEEDDVPYANLEVIESILTDMEKMKDEAHIELILEELNRQYREWKMNSAATE